MADILIKQTIFREKMAKQTRMLELVSFNNILFIVVNKSKEYVTLINIKTRRHKLVKLEETVYSAGIVDVEKLL